MTTATAATLARRPDIQLDREGDQDAAHSNFKVTGEITVKNPNDQAVDFMSLTSWTTARRQPWTAIRNSRQPGLWDRPCQRQHRVPYIAYPTSKDAKQNNVLVDSKTDGVPGATALAPIKWKENVKGDETVKLVDTRLGYDQSITDTTTFTKPEDVRRARATRPSTPMASTPTRKRTPPRSPAPPQHLKGCQGRRGLHAGGADRHQDCPGQLRPHDHLGSDEERKPRQPQRPGRRLFQLYLDREGDQEGRGRWQLQGHGRDHRRKLGRYRADLQRHRQARRRHDGSRGLRSATAGDQASARCQQAASVECAYTASTANAKENTATVSAPGNGDVMAKASVSYTPIIKGDESVTLADPRFSYSQLISASTTKTFPETFTCPTDPTKYTNNLYLQDVHQHRHAQGRQHQPLQGRHGHVELQVPVEGGDRDRCWHAAIRAPATGSCTRRTRPPRST